MYQQATVIGHLGADPEMRYTANGAAVSNFSVAAGRRWTSKDGEQHEDTEWFRVVAWNRLAEICAQYLTKGRLVFVQGRMQTRSWDDQQGQKRYMTELIAQEVKFLGGGSDRAPSGFSAPDSGEINPDELPF